MARVVMDGVAADLVRAVIVRPQHLGHRRITVDDLDPDAMALPEAERHRLEPDVEAIDLAGHERLRRGMGVVGIELRAARGIKRAVRGAQPPPGDDLAAGIESLAALFARLRKLVAQLDEEI